jgi:hypothetical protein
MPLLMPTGSDRYLSLIGATTARIALTHQNSQI